MVLSSGAKLGPYEIVAPLGAGGMGEVYLARDTRLERSVAIKVLPAHLSQNTEAKERLDREARAISSLSHPNICHLYDVGQQDGTSYLVMEYLEGETLADRLLKGPLPLEQVLKTGAEICEGLEKAHCSGVAHRDLKPSNIMLTRTGAKLMDFGLAKPAAAAIGAGSSSASLATMSKPLTVEGTILGTFQYMSPEQLEGKEADVRSDIFSLGAVLYEMITGKRAFEGRTTASTIAAILAAEPKPISALQPMSPRALELLVKACLEKDPADRMQTAHDVKLQLKWIAEGGSEVAPLSGATERGTPRLHTLIISLGTLLLGAVIASLAAWNLKPEPPRPVSRTVITLPPGQRLAGLDQPAIALSPDGTHLAYVAVQGGRQQLYLRAMDSLEARPIPGTESATGPFFSPDGQWLGFFADQKLKKVSVSGGSALTLADVAFPLGASWDSHGMITFAPSVGSAIREVAEAGGASQPLTRLGRGEITHRWPEFLPDGKAMLFSAGPTSVNWTNAYVAVRSVETGEQHNLVQGATQPRYAPTGHLLYAQVGSLMAAPFDSQRLTVAGAGVPVVEGILQSTTSGVAQYSISATGSLVYIPGDAQAAQNRLVWVDRTGAERPIAAPARPYVFPRLSPDGRRLAVTLQGQDVQLWLYDFSRETLTRFAFEGKFNANPVWTPDGKRIVFNSNKEGPNNLFWQLADGSGGLERLTTSEFLDFPMSWSPNGQVLAYVEVTPSTGYDLWTLGLGDRKAQPFLQTQFNESVPQFSPDGRWLAYISNESGRWEVYVQPYPSSGGKWQISTEGGTEPIWNRNGRELFYRNGDKMMAVDIAAQPSFAAGKPHMLFEGHYVPPPGTTPNYDVSPDGQRFLMIKPNEAGEAAPAQINVVLNWFEELKRLVPVGKK
ncbi:MAG TPA: protein kinase [Candidatus Sulfotelmatobacter sp.]|nr:protein kinase [Candidatus Sulfotelmatobacter sp.]